MRKIITFFYMAILVLTGTTAIAGNRCLTLIDAHATSWFLDLSSCDLHPDDLAGVEAYLEQHPSIFALNLEGNGRVFSYTNASILARNTTLQWLNVNQTMQYVSPDLVVNELVKMPRLDRLSVQYDGITTQAMASLVNDNKLRWIDLTGNSRIDNDGLLMLASNHHILFMNLKKIPISNQAAYALSQNAVLEGIILGDSDGGLGESGLIGFATNAHLTNLSIIKENVSPAIVLLLSKNTHLNKIVLQNDHLKDADAVTLAKNKNLASLDLSNNDVQEAGCKAIAALPRLKSLNLNSSLSQYNHCIVSFSKMKTLTSLYLDDDFIVPSDWKEFENNTSLSILSINTGYKIHISANIASIAKIKSLTELDVSGALSYPDDVITLVKNSSISSLDLSYNLISEQAIQALADDTHLTKLTLEGVGINDHYASIIAKSSSLRVLDVGLNSIADKGALAFAQFAHLKKLYIFENPIHDAGIEAMKASPNIATLVF